MATTTRYVTLYSTSGGALASFTLPTQTAVNDLKQKVTDAVNGSAANVIWAAPTQSVSGQSVERLINLSAVGQVMVQTVTQ